VRTKHHLVPKCWKHNRGDFFNTNGHCNLVWVSEQDHRAWNQLTQNSQMTLGEIASSLSRFIPRDYVVKIERRTRCNQTG